MATDGPTPAPCDREVFEHGDAIFVTSTIPSNAMERWVRKVAERSGARVDWHFVGGRAVVLYLGDRGRVRAAIADLLDEHDALYRTAVRALGLACDGDVPHWFPGEVAATPPR